MTSQEKIKKALNFLLTTNAKGASFDYYDDKKAEWNRYEDWLFKFFRQEEIPENEWYPIVNELASRDLIEVNPPETKIDKTPPNQIKISFKGMSYLDPNNQTAIIAEESIKKLELENLILQNTDLKRKIPFAIIGFFSGGILSIILMYISTKILETKQENKQPLQIQISIPQLKTDTCCIINSDSLKPKK